MLKETAKQNYYLILLAAFFLSSSCSKTTEYKYSEKKPKSLVIYSTDNIKGYNNKPIIVDYPFIKTLKRVDYYAKKCDLTLYVTSSFRTPNQNVSGAIVKPATTSNHLAGHAIDMNIEYHGHWYDSSAMRKSNLKNLPHNLRVFIQSIRNDKHIRWGGDFNNQDPVHIDDHLNKNYNNWLKRYKACQTAYARYKKH